MINIAHFNEPEKIKLFNQYPHPDRDPIEILTGNSDSLANARATIDISTGKVSVAFLRPEEFHAELQMSEGRTLGSNSVNASAVTKAVSSKLKFANVLTKVPKTTLLAGGLVATGYITAEEMWTKSDNPDSAYQKVIRPAGVKIFEALKKVVSKDDSLSESKPKN